MNHCVSHLYSGYIYGPCQTCGQYPKAFSYISSHHGSHYKAQSDHGSTKISFSTHFSSDSGQWSVHDNYSHCTILANFASHSDWKKTSLLSYNGKQTMQHLNQRLSSYLEKVHSLEHENTQLEMKICEWYENNTPRSLPDSSQYFRTITELETQVSSITVENMRIILQIDNVHLATDDLINEYEMEHNIRNSVDADIARLQIELEELNNQRQDLEIQDHCLHEELLQLKSREEEEMRTLQPELGIRVNVNLKAAPSVDLNRALSEIRGQYENLMERSLREIEDIFLIKSSELNSEAEHLKSLSNELVNLKSSMQALEIELQTELSLKSVLECSLTETETTFGSQLVQLQDLINNIEAQLSQIPERQNDEYQVLMDQKTHLETEIASYKHLLDGHDISISSPETIIGG